MSNIRVTHHDGSVETFEDARFEVIKGGALKVKESGQPTRFFSPSGWKSATKSEDAED